MTFSMLWFVRIYFIIAIKIFCHPLDFFNYVPAFSALLQVYMYKVAKIAPSSKVETTFNSFIFIFTKWQNQAILANHL